MPYIPAHLQHQILARASGRCEYCQLSQIGQEATFHIDHVIPVVESGRTAVDNLALACVSCSLRKGARHYVEDPDSREKINLFNPRQERWSDHFRWEGVEIIGMTPWEEPPLPLLK